MVCNEPHRPAFRGEVVNVITEPEVQLGDHRSTRQSTGTSFRSRRTGPDRPVFNMSRVASAQRRQPLPQCIRQQQNGVIERDPPADHGNHEIGVLINHDAGLVEVLMW